MRKMLTLGITLLVIGSCKQTEEKELNTGMWRGSMELMDGKELPFIFRIDQDNEAYLMKMFNAEEEVLVDEVTIAGDSIKILMPVFEGYIAGTFAKDKIQGNFIKESLDRVVPFMAVYGEQERFTTKIPPSVNISGVWETSFSPTTADSLKAKGIFRQNGNKVTGTFRTPKGDYRYLEGVMDADSLRLSTFDGAHAFLFTARATDSSLTGTFYSGNHFKEPFIAWRNEAFELPDENTLTYLKEGYDAFTFSFPDETGALVSLDHDMFKDRVVVVQIMGTWCPNCLDESKFLVDYLGKTEHKELQVVALAFEYAKTKEGAFKGISRLRDRIGIDYPILLAQYGTSDKKIANEKLPMLNHVLSYPTTLFIDRKGVVRKIHTGFNGPATGDKYTEFKQEFEATIAKLVAE